jgi:hypothetical protein
MKPIPKYIERKPDQHTDQATAWIARVWPSASGKTLYFNGMALKRFPGNDCNHYDLVSGDEFWVSGVKKRGTNRHPCGGGTVLIEKCLLAWYEEYAEKRDTCGIEVVADIAKPDTQQFHAIENKPMTE